MPRRRCGGCAAWCYIVLACLVCASAAHSRPRRSSDMRLRHRPGVSNELLAVAKTAASAQAGVTALAALDTHKPRVFYISETKSGGSLKYIRDLETHYRPLGITFTQLSSVKDALLELPSMREGDILLFQYLYDTDFNADIVVDLIQTAKLRLVIPIHDEYFLNDDPQWDYKYNPRVHHNNPRPSIASDKLKLLARAEKLVFPSHYILNVIKQHLSLDTMVVVPHLDLQVLNYTHVPAIADCINIGLITEISHTKGVDMLKTLVRQPRSRCVRFYVYHEFNAEGASNVVVRGRYTEETVFTKLAADSVHGLLFLNNYAETYSYALTKGINSGLPLLYTDTGAVAERLHALGGDAKFVPTNNRDVVPQFERLLDYIQTHAGKTAPKFVSPACVTIPKFYDDLFFRDSPDYGAALDARIAATRGAVHRAHQIIEPYAIYFPQFHRTPENDENIYLGYTDMVNLAAAKARHPNLLTPLKRVLGYYDLARDRHIVPTQTKLARAYGFRGFALYYYWFSVNDVSNSSTIFQTVIDQFFERPLGDDFSVFFVWCNEQWTGNVAFNVRDTTAKVYNTYDDQSIARMLVGLVRYFKHPNYRKIDGRPVFFVHQPYDMTDAQLQRVKVIGDEVARRAGFAGLHMVVDRRDKSRPGLPNYYTHSNYKSDRQDMFVTVNKYARFLDYEKYTRLFTQYDGHRDGRDVINTVFTNFNNAVRFYVHKNPENFVTITVNNTLPQFRSFLDAQMAKYVPARDDELRRIFLVNSWNEWGEQMVLEPSNEQGFGYLESFYDALISLLASTLQ